MRITRIELHRLTVPLAHPWVSAGGSRRAIDKIVVRVLTDDGFEGLGETIGTNPVWAFLCDLGRALIGRDPADVNALRRTVAPGVLGFSQGRDGWIAWAALDMACWDILGRRLGVPLSALWGGRQCDTVPVAGCLGAGPGDVAIADFQADLDNAWRYAEGVAGFVTRHGFGTVKLKSTGTSPAWDRAAIGAVREVLGPAVALRVDWNGRLGGAEAQALGRALAPLGLEYFEDPVSGLDALARLRRDLAAPIATNMAVDHIHHVAPAFRLGAIDVLLADVYTWGGVGAVRDLSGVAEALGLPIVLHSWFELGIATALNLHLAAADSASPRAMDTTLHLFADDIVADEPFRITAGTLAVPDGPGLGVALAPDRLARWSAGATTIAA